MRRSANRKHGKRGCFHRLQGCYIFFAILMILSAILVPNFIRARAHGQHTACKSNLKNLATGLGMYQKDHDGALPPNLQALVPEYLRQIPECPSAEANTYFATFGPRAPFNDTGSEDYVLLECMGHHHQDIAVKPNYPKYTSHVGLVVKKIVTD